MNDKEMHLIRSRLAEHQARMAFLRSHHLVNDQGARAEDTIGIAVLLLGEIDRLRGKPAALDVNAMDEALQEISERLGQPELADTGAQDPSGRWIEIERWRDYDGAGEDVALLLARVRWLGKRLVEARRHEADALVKSAPSGNDTGKPRLVTWRECSNCSYIVDRRDRFCIKCGYRLMNQQGN